MTKAVRIAAIEIHATATTPEQEGILVQERSKEVGCTQQVLLDAVFDLGWYSASATGSTEDLFF